jgi:uncharacterized protein (TIGR03437 family)
MAACAIIAIALALVPAAAQSNCAGTCLQTKSFETVAVGSAALQSGWPAGCSSFDPGCIGGRVVVVWFQGQGTKTVLSVFSALFDESRGVTVISEDKTQHPRVALSTSSSTPKDFSLVFYAAPDASTKYQLLWPGNDLVDLAPFFPSQLPTIKQSGVASGASFSPGIVPGSWVTISGTNLADATDTWDKAIADGKLPTTLGGVSVNIGGKAAYIQYISAGQINALAPDVGFGPMPVTVTNSKGTSATMTVMSQQFGPAFFLWTGKYAVATRTDYTIAAKSGLFPGTTTVAAKPGDVIILWGTGFGPTEPLTAAGIRVPGDRTYNTANPVTVTVGNVSAQVYGAALAPGYAGLYQIALQIPGSTPDGDIPVKASIGGIQSPDNVFITVQH